MMKYEFAEPVNIDSPAFERVSRRFRSFRVPFTAELKVSRKGEGRVTEVWWPDGSPDPSLFPRQRRLLLRVLRAADHA